MHRESKPTIIVAANIAFCSGVERAILLAESESKLSSQVYTADSILHNEEEIKRLESIGVRKASNNDSGKVVLLPAHGATSAEVASLSKRFEKIVDTTCPLVLRTANLIELVKKEGYKIAIVGDENHRETTVLKDKAGEALFGVFKDSASLDNMPTVPKLAVVAQSTSTEDELFSIAKKLLEKTRELRFFNTICSETLMRQSEAKALAKKVDCMLVIGSKTSANSKSLFEIVRAVNSNAYFVHKPNDLRLIDFSGYSSIGVTSGTSTPSWLIQKIISEVSKVI